MSCYTAGIEPLMLPLELETALPRQFFSVNTKQKQNWYIIDSLGSQIRARDLTLQLSQVRLEQQSTDVRVDGPAGACGKGLQAINIWDNAVPHQARLPRCRHCVPMPTWRYVVTFWQDSEIVDKAGPSAPDLARC
jgi:hypothetical protein